MSTTALPSLADPNPPTHPSPPLPPQPNNPTDPEASALSTHTHTNPRTSLTASTTSTSPPWGPSHPCYPHPNPHVPLTSPLSNTTRIIRIPRDWMPHGDLAPQFSPVYPEILSRWVSEEDFRQLVTHVNEGLWEAFRPEGWMAWRDMILGVATGWLWEDLGGNGVGVKKGVRGVEGWIEGWNLRREGGMGVGVGEEAGLVKCVGLRRTGFLCLDIQIPDPQVRFADPDEEDVTAPSTVRDEED
ncbi:MAG: hypothetical protein Q9186_000329 [Xanthomendoza sp. 1 TL-2023]